MEAPSNENEYTNSENEDNVSLLSSQTFARIDPNSLSKKLDPQVDSLIQIERISITKPQTKQIHSDSEPESSPALLTSKFIDSKSNSPVNQVPEQHVINGNINFLLESSNAFKQASIKLNQDGPNSHFLDPLFPANTDSIVGFSHTSREHYDNNTVWLRPNLFGFQNSGVTVYNDLNFATIQQGKIGDCYFLAACCSLAQTPKRLSKLFLTGKHWQQNGLHAVALNLNGFWEEVLVDDLFPCHNQSGWPLFTTSSDGSLWIMLLEKAWAKVHSGYFQIKTGFSREALRDLTGAPTKSFFFKKSNTKKIWKELLHAFEHGFAVCSSSFNWKKKQKKKWLLDHGLRTSHAYSVLDSFECKVKGTPDRNST